jgi:hypothetical protein
MSVNDGMLNLIRVTGHGRNNKTNGHDNRHRLTGSGMVSLEVLAASEDHTT